MSPLRREMPAAQINAAHWAVSREKVAATRAHPDLTAVLHKIQSLYINRLHKPVMTVGYTAIHIQHTISLDIESIPLCSITPWVTDAETCREEIKPWWWGWHLTSALISSCFDDSNFMSFLNWFFPSADNSRRFCLLHQPRLGAPLY